MSPIENFENKVLLATAVMFGHVARCCEKAGLLDDDAKASIRAHFSDLSEAAVALDEAEVLAWVDTLARALPPLGKGDNSRGG